MNKHTLLMKKILEYTWLGISIAAVIGFVYELSHQSFGKNSVILISIAIIGVGMFWYRRKNRIEYMQKNK